MLSHFAIRVAFSVSELIMNLQAIQASDFAYAPHSTVKTMSVYQIAAQLVKLSYEGRYAEWLTGR